MKDVIIVDELRARNETLARELAESCCDMVEHQFAYKTLWARTRALERAFVATLMRHKIELTEMAARQHVERSVETQMSEAVDV